MDKFCDNILLTEPVDVFGNKIGSTMVALSIIYLATSLILLYYIRIQEYYGKRRDPKAMRVVIFPMYNYILWANALVNVYVGFIGLYYSFQPFENNGDKVSSWAFAIMWALQHAVVEGVPIMLMQKGLGRYALSQAGKQTFVWFVYTLFNQLAIYATKNLGSFLFSMVWQIILLVFYGCLWGLPQKKLFRRPAVINYALFWFVFRILSIISTIMYFVNATHSTGNCIYVIGTLFPYAILEPFTIYYTLLQDSKWWQGLDIMQGRRVQAAEEIRSPMIGFDLNLASAQSLAKSMDNMSLGAYRRGGIPVRLLNFAYIHLDKNRQLGSGSFSKVYLGSYRNEKCAIKMIFTLDLTQDVIHRVAAEAQILSMIKHRNIVNILGVSVLPPSVCILLELCVYGSLADVIKGAGPLAGFNADSDNYNPNLTISWADRLYLAVGCARGINALHGYNGELCHRDIKSFNFLVDQHLNAKISDLELGITEDLKPELTFSKLLKRGGSFLGRKKITGFSVNSGSNTDSEQVSELGIGEGVLRAEDFLANWSAPEVIKDGLHVQASDMYSFSLVLWEILTGIVPFSETRKQDDIRFRVLSGERPTIPPCPLDHEDAKYYHHYTALITRGWQHEASARPSSIAVLSELECIWMSCCNHVVSETDVAPDMAEIFDEAKNRKSNYSMWSALTSQSPTGPTYTVTDANRERICDAMKEDQDSFRELDNHTGAWLVVTKDSPHVVLRCNIAFTALSGLQMNDILGLPLKATPMFGEKTESSHYEEFLSSLEDNERTPAHSLLTLYHSLMVGGTIKMQSPSIYSLHAFPVFKKTIAPPPPSSLVKRDSEAKLNDAGDEIPAGSIPIGGAAPAPQEESLRSLSFSFGSSPPIKSVQQLKAIDISSVAASPADESAIGHQTESGDRTVDLLVGQPATSAHLSQSLKESQSRSLYQSRQSVNSINTADSSATPPETSTPSRSFFGFRKKTHSLSVADNSRSRGSTIGALLANAGNIKTPATSHQSRPVAVVAILFSRIKQLSPPLRENATTSRASGLFRRNTEDMPHQETSFAERYHSGSRGESLQNKESLTSALMPEEAEDSTASSQV